MEMMKEMGIAMNAGRRLDYNRGCDDSAFCNAD
jgi:hypothetical protein